MFEHNEAIYGGAFWLRNTVVYVQTGSTLWFEHNFATSFGGGVNIYFTNTNIQTEDILSYSVIGNSSAIFNLNDLHKLILALAFPITTTILKLLCSQLMPTFSM